MGTGLGDLPFVNIDLEDDEDRERKDAEQVTLDLSDEKERPATNDGGDHFANLADDLADDPDVVSFVQGLSEAVERDLNARSDWDEALRKGLEELGINRIETRDIPFVGASTARHPMILRAVIESVSRIVKELQPLGGPLKAEPVTLGLVPAQGPDGALGALKGMGIPGVGDQGALPSGAPPEAAGPVTAPPPGLPAGGGMPQVPGVPGGQIGGPAPGGQPPEGGPDLDQPLIDQAARVQSYMNWSLTTRIPGYREGYERSQVIKHLFGTSLRKVYYGAGVPRADAVMPQNFIVPPETTDLGAAPRKTHLMRVWKHEVEEYVEDGVWREVDLEPDGSSDSESASVKEARTIIGTKETASVEDERYTIYESCVVADLEGDGPAPYIVTFEKQTCKILAIRRNWEPDDDSKKEIVLWVAGRLYSWMDFYGLGLIHILGGLSQAATGALRATLDTGVMSNSVGGLVDSSVKFREGSRLQVKPYELMQVEAGNALAGQGRSIRDLILPFAALAQVNPQLVSLLELIIGEGASLGRINLDDLSADNAKAGAVMGIIDERSAPLSGVYVKAHVELGQEFELLKGVIRRHFDDIDHGPYEGIVAPEDFGDDVTVKPAADPDNFSLLQRYTQAQFGFELAKALKEAGVEVDLKAAGMALAKAGRVSTDGWFKKEEQAPKPAPLDPVSEWRAIADGQPVKAFPGQAHEAHIAFHRAVLSDKALATSLEPLRPRIDALIVDHAVQAVSDMIAMATGMQPQPGQPLPPQAVPIAAQAAQALIMQRVQMAAAMDPGILAVQRDADRKDRQMEAQMELETARTMQADDHLRLKQETTVAIETARLQFQKEIAEIKQQHAVQIAQIQAQAKAMVDQARVEVQKELEVIRQSSNERMLAAKLDHEQQIKAADISSGHDQKTADLVAKERDTAARLGAQVEAAKVRADAARDVAAAKAITTPLSLGAVPMPADRVQAALAAIGTGADFSPDLEVVRLEGHLDNVDAQATQKFASAKKANEPNIATKTTKSNANSTK